MPRQHMIELTFCDHDHNEFVPLKTYGFDTVEKLNRYWNAIPEGPMDSPYLADRHDLDGLSETRYVSVAWIEEITGMTIEDLIASSPLRAH